MYSNISPTAVSLQNTRKFNAMSHRSLKCPWEEATWCVEYEAPPHPTWLPHVYSVNSSKITFNYMFGGTTTKLNDYIGGVGQKDYLKKMGMKHTKITDSSFVTERHNCKFRKMFCQNWYNKHTCYSAHQPRLQFTSRISVTEMRQYLPNCLKPLTTKVN